MEDTKNQGGMGTNGKSCACGGGCPCGTGCSCGHGFRRHCGIGFFLRALIGFIILIVVFAIGVRVGEFKAAFRSFENYRGAMMFGDGGYSGGSASSASAPTATSTAATP